MNKPVAIITGAGRGIGRATVRRFADAGYAVALLARSEDDLRESSRGLDDALVLPTDVAESTAIDRAVQTTLQRFGRIDAAIHVAGYAPLLPITQITDAIWRQVMDVNLSGAFFLARACWETFAAQKGGAFVNVSSLAARDPFPGFSAYACAKAAVNQLGMSLALEGKPLGIRAYTVAPGAVETGMFRAILSEAEFSREKTLDPQDVASVILQCVAGDLRHSSGEVIWMQK